jgi:uncharacterized protein
MPQIRRLTWLMLVLGSACRPPPAVIWEANRTARPEPDQDLCRPVLQPVAADGDGVLRAGHRAAGAAAGLAPLVQALRSWPGRMPLTNYLMQTALCTTLFYHWGFGLWAQVGPAAGLALSLALFFLLQVPLSQPGGCRGTSAARWKRCGRA